RYNRGQDDAPVVTAKGVDFLALKMREIAFEFSVPIVERPTLARALYQVSKVGKPIPVEFFRAVAEVIAFVYRIKGYHLEKR
ncbi:MAG: EscU/YscU/HrcU family type III secretion system export apparatus switch protein, partial [Deltaproteobacteria bacterium]|nr:EscU/YscU/HrcU family type III secretion system export apparatus switch protein [Deltaproteobacteria bacterium]